MGGVEIWEDMGGGMWEDGTLCLETRMFGVKVLPVISCDFIRNVFKRNVFKTCICNLVH